MVDPNFDKEMQNTLLEFEKAKDWEWADLIKWLRKVHSLVLKYPSSKIPQTYNLAKRLSQCLNPALPQGLHYIVLEIYKSLLQHHQTNQECFDEELALYSAGILPFFQNASPENKPAVLSIVEAYFVPVGKEISFAFPGIVTSLLPGLEDGNPDVENQTIQVFDKLAESDPSELYGAVWQALLRTPKVRKPAIKFLMKKIPKDPQTELDQFLPQRNLVVNSIISSLNDEQVLVQRSALDFLKSHFPINNQVLTPEELTAVLEAVLHLLSNRDFTLIRRVWEWMLQNEEDPSEDTIMELMEYLVPAINNIFGVHPVSKQEAIMPMLILEPLLQREKLSEVLLQEVTVTVLSYAERYKEDKELSEDVLFKCSQIFGLLRENVSVVWESLDNFLTEQLNVEPLRAIQIIRFYIESFPIESETSALHIVPILENLLTYMHSLSQQSLSSAISLAQIILDRLQSVSEVELSDAIYGFNSFFQQLVQNQEWESIEDLEGQVSLCLSLEKYSHSTLDWVNYLLQLTENPQVEVALIGVEALVHLIKAQSKAYQKAKELKGEGLCLEIMELLWDQLNNPDHRQKVSKLIITLEQGDREVFTQVICRELVDKDLENTIQRFNSFWRSVNEINPDEIKRLFLNGEGIFTMLDHLEHESPKIRHMAREWLMISLPKFTCVLDSLFSRLLKPILKETLDTQYDHKVVLDAFKKLKSLVTSAFEIVVGKAQMLSLSPTLEVPKDWVRTNYLTLTVEVALKYLSIDSKESFKELNQSVQASACELLELVLSEVSLELASSVLPTVLKCIFRSMQNEDRVMQLLLLNILQVVFFRCQVHKHRETCAEQLKSTDFSMVYLNALHVKDTYVRSHWVGFIVESLPIITSLLKPPELTHYVKTQLENFCGLLVKSEGKRSLFQGLQALVHHTLRLSDTQDEHTHNNLVSNFPDLLRPSPQPRTSFLGLFKIWGAEEAVTYTNPYQEVIHKIFTKFPKIIQTCVQCLETPNFQTEIRAYGTEPFKNQETKPIQHKEVLDLLNPIAKGFPEELLESVMDLWVKKTIQNPEPTPESDEELFRLVSIMISLDLDPLGLVETVNQFLVEKLQLYKSKKNKPAQTDFKEVALAHFLYSFFSLCPKSKFTSQKYFWAEVLKMLRELDCSNLPEMQLWVLELFFLLLQKLSIDKTLKEKKVRKDFQELFQRLITQTTSATLNEGPLLSYPNLPSAYAVTQDQVNLGLACVVTLKTTFYSTVRALWQEDGFDKVTYQIQSSAGQLLSAVISKTQKTNVEIITEFLCVLLNEAGSQLAKIFKKDILDALASNEFFQNMGANHYCLKNWKSLVSIISMFCYPDKIMIIQELLNRVTTGMFVSRASEYLQKAKILRRIAFMIYSGGIDDYQQSLQLVIEKIIEYLRTDESLLPSVLFLLRVLILRLSPGIISEIWPRLWPHVLTELMQVVEQQNKNPQNFLATLKFLELISVVNNEDFHMYQWIFFFDSLSIGESNEFQPLVPRVVMPEAMRWKESEKKSNKGYLVKRKLVVKKHTSNDIQELFGLARLLINYIANQNLERCEPDWEEIHSLIETDFLNEN